MNIKLSFKTALFRALLLKVKLFKFLNPIIFNNFDVNYFNKYIPCNNLIYPLATYILPPGYISSVFYGLLRSPLYVLPGAPPIRNTRGYNNGYGGNYPAKPLSPFSNYPSVLAGRRGFYRGSSTPLPPPPPPPLPLNPNSNTKNININNPIKYFKKENVSIFNPF